MAVALHPRRARRSPTSPRRSASAARSMPARCSTVSPARGPTGAGRAATSRPRRTPARSSTSTATCWRCRWRAPNSPQWFNTGLHWAYGIDGPGQGHFYVDHQTGESDVARRRPTSIRSRTPASSSRSMTISSTRTASWTCGCAKPACSSTAPAPAPTSPRCAARTSALSGGGRSSGLMSFLKIGDRAAGAIKSGGTTRRAAKMVVVDVDHPDIEEYIDWKVKEEQKVAALVTGSKIAPKRLKAIMKACVNCDAEGGVATRRHAQRALLRSHEEPEAQGAPSRRPVATRCRTTTSAASSSSRARASRRSTSRPTTPIGTARPI